MSKLKSLDDCYSGRDFEQYAQEHELDQHKNGSYIEIRSERGSIYIPDTARTLPKTTRVSIAAAFVRLGLVAAAVAAVLAAVGWWMG